MTAKHKTKERPEREATSDPQQPFMDFGEAIRTMLQTPPIKNPTDKASFTVHKGALADVQEPLIEDISIASPFVKWAGGKRSLMPSIKAHLPPEFNNYYEGFLGGGAVYYALYEMGLIKHAFLSDNNLDLVITYQVIKKDPKPLIARLKQLAAKHSEKQFYAVRDEVPTDEIEVAARFIYLNKTCFNGLYRVNKAGKFNVPIGDYKNPNIADETNLLACHRALQDATISYHDYRMIEPRPKRGDFIYLDSPYHPTNDVSFTAYTKENFTEQNQLELRDYALELHRAGVYVMLSNSKTKLIEDLYGDRAFHLHTVQAPRTVNCKGGSRGAVNEYLITTY